MSPSTYCSKIFPNVAELTFVVVRIVSLEFRPLRLLSNFCVVTLTAGLEAALRRSAAKRATPEWVDRPARQSGTRKDAGGRI
jgi:hypothetical protein